MQTPTRVRKPSLKQRIEIAAFAMFEEMGIGHVSVDAIAEAAETNKMGVYRQFGSKDALVEAWLGNTIIKYRSILDELDYRFPGAPIEQLRGFARYVADSLPALASRGCPFVNTIAEIGDSAHPLIKRIAAHKAQQARRLVALCEQARMASPEVTAAQITFLLEGAQITAQNGSIDNLGTLLMSMIEDILAGAPQGPEVSEVA